MNRLADETSPYLLQHADNPVDWYPWGDEALARARDEDRPILLSIGYAACHWCHVMERESFEDALTARVLNEHFVSIKVDREERPDLDSIYMDAVVALTGSGGWPMTVFLTPAGEPFFGGTYFPPEPRHGLPSFKQVLLGVAEAWRDQRDEVDTLGRNLAEHIRSSAHLTAVERAARPTRCSTDAQRALARGLRPAVGRLGAGAEVPARAGARVPAASRRGGDDAPHARRDGARRHVRPRRRRLPPLLGRRALARAALREDALRQRAARVRLPARRTPLRRASATARSPTQTLDYVLRELALDGGGFASAQDADTDGVEGLTFSWAPGEGAPEELLQPFEHGRFVLRGELDEATRARLFDAARAAAEAARDDKAIASWNGLMLAALAQGGRLEPAVGARASSCSARSRRRDGRLHRTWRDGVAKGTGYLEDYADVAYGLMELHVASGDPRWLREAHRLATARGRAVRRPGRRRLLPDAGRRRAARRAQEGARRPPDAERQRDARLRAAAPRAHLGRRRARAARRLGAPASSATRSSRAPSAFGWLLVALDQHLAPHRELAIVGAPDARGRARCRRRRRADRRDRVRSRRRRAAARRARRGRRPCRPSTSASASRASCR